MHRLDKLKQVLADIREDAATLEFFYATLRIDIPWLKPEEVREILVEAHAFNHLDHRAELWQGQSYALLDVFTANFVRAIERGLEIMEAFEMMGEREASSMTAIIPMLGYRSLGSLDKALIYMQKALALLPEIEESSMYYPFKAITHYQAGELYSQINNYEQALIHFRSGLEHCVPLSNLTARLHNGMGVTYMQTGDMDKALSNLTEALDSARMESNPVQLSKCVLDLGNYYFRMKDYPSARRYYTESLDLRVANKLQNPLITSYIQLADLHFEEGNDAEAIRFGNLAVEQAEILNVQIKLYEAHLILSRVYERSGEMNKAFVHFKKYTEVKESVMTKEVHRQAEQLNSQHKLEMMQHEKEIFRLRNVELKQALNEISESITYARRIQQAILPPVHQFDEQFRDYFLSYKPKDIVAGDFYWLEEIDGTLYFAIADCTGHGVPGAMVSVVCHNALNRAVKEYGQTIPGKILDYTAKLVVEQFEKSEDAVKDGMDIVLCSLKNNVLRYSGANNPLWLIREGELQQIKGMKQPIGVHTDLKPFETHEIALQKDDLVFLFSDGFSDQFGGARGKKFSSKRFRELLTNLSDLPMPELGTQLDTAFGNWKGDLEQLDDVCVMGIRF